MSRDSSVIHYAARKTPLGPLQVAATPRGICAAAFGRSKAAVARGLLARFPGARLISGGGGIARLAARVARLILRPAADPGLPLDLRGTAFQLGVWNALRRIPPGRTATYAGIARRAGRPGAVRAVAAACAANPVAVVVPCHRVIRSNGELSGYRWGVKRKRMLLAREAVANR